MIISFFRAIKFAFQDFWRNFWLSLVTMSILVLTLLTINILVVFHFVTQTSVDLVESRVDVVLDFKKEAEDSEVMYAKGIIETWAEVSSVSFVSREQKISDFQSLHADDPSGEAIKELEDNPFGPMLIIKADKMESYQIILQKIIDQDFTKLIDNANYRDQQNLINGVLDITNKAKVVGQVLMLIFAMIAILIVFNSIRVSIYTHRHEIKIMKSVGAANLFVRAPFIFEGIIFSIFSWAITVGLWVVILYFIDPYINYLFSGNASVVNYFSKYYLEIFGLELAGIILINVFSSTWAIGRYLR